MSEQPRGFFDGSPKMMFVFGLVTGIALSMLVNNFAGISLAANNGGRNVAQGNTPVVAGTTDTTGTTAPKELAAVTADDHVRGDLKKAKVVLIEYSDFECPYCGAHHPTMEQIMKDYGDQVAWVYRHFPLSFHPEANPAALASECASEQGKFWEFADDMFANQDKLGDDYFSQVAKDLGLNVSKFNSCYTSAKYQSVIDGDASTGRAAGVNGTPATFINGQFVSGAVPYSTMKQVIDSELAK